MKTAKMIKNVTELVGYLEKNGYSVSKATVYRHIAAGKLRKLPSGSFIRQAVDRYARSYLQRSYDMADESGISLPEDLRMIEHRKRRAQAELLELKAREIQGGMISTAEHEHLLLQRLITVKAAFMNGTLTVAEEVASFFNMDPTRMPELIALLRDVAEAAMGELSKNREYAFVPCNGCPLLPPEDGKHVRCFSVRVYPETPGEGEYWK